MKRPALLAALLLAAADAAAGGTAHRASVLVVVGAAGEAEYGTNFLAQAARWEAAAARGGAAFRAVGTEADGTNDLARLREALAAEGCEGPAPLWLVLIGHGTFDGREARFNLRGPDLSAAELAGWLKPFRRPLAVINAASASAPFLAALAGPDRVVITATRSGFEQNYARFGAQLAAALDDPAADLDADGQASLLELFLTASARVREWYAAGGRLATEHALLDDDGDGKGTPAEWFRGLHPTKQPEGGAAADGLRAHQWHLVPSAAEAALTPERRARRDELERAVAELRARRAALAEEDFLAKLEPLLRELAGVYE